MWDLYSVKLGQSLANRPGLKNKKKKQYAKKKKHGKKDWQLKTSEDTWNSVSESPKTRYLQEL